MACRIASKPGRDSFAAAVVVVLDDVDVDAGGSILDVVAGVSVRPYWDRNS